MAFFARLHAVILLAIISMVTASLINNLDAFEELHVVSTEVDTLHGLDHLPGIAARIIARDVVTATATRVVTEINCGPHVPCGTGVVPPFESPTDLVVSGVPTVVATEPVTTISASVTEVTKVTISLPGTTPVTLASLSTPVIEVTSATLLVSVTATETEPCPEPTEVTSVSFYAPGTEATSATFTETEPCPSSTESVPFPSTGNVSKGTTSSVSTQTFKGTTSSISTQTFKVIPKPPLSSVTPGVVKVGTTSPVGAPTLSTGIKSTGIAITVSCSNCAKGPSPTTITTAAHPSGVTNTTHSVTPTTSVLVHTGVADHQSGFLTHAIVVAVFIVVFLNAL